MTVGPAQFGAQLTTTVGPGALRPGAGRQRRQLARLQPVPRRFADRGDRRHRARHVRVQHQGAQRPERRRGRRARLQLGGQRRQPPVHGSRRRRAAGDHPVVVHAPLARAGDGRLPHRQPGRDHGPVHVRAPGDAERRRRHGRVQLARPDAGQDPQARRRRAGRRRRLVRLRRRSVPDAVHRLRSAVGNEHGHAARGRRGRAAPRPPSELDARPGEVGADDDRHEEVFLDTAGAVPAGVLDRGSGSHRPRGGRQSRSHARPPEPERRRGRRRDRAVVHDPGHRHQLGRQPVGRLDHGVGAHDHPVDVGAVRVGIEPRRRSA